MTQLSFLGPSDESVPKPGSDVRETLRLLITVKAAPIPSTKYGETVCVAGLNLSMTRPGWIRLYPINLRHLDANDQFKKYDIVTVDAAPAREARTESWCPDMSTLRQEGHLGTADGWKKRRALLEPFVEGSMCQLNAAAAEDPTAKSLALIRPRQVQDFIVTEGSEWTPEQQRKIDRYVSQLDLFDPNKRAALQAPAYVGTYRYVCQAPTCRGHRQQLNDWEFVAYQRRLVGQSVGAIKAELRKQFLEKICDASHDVAFFVGNQAARPQSFSILGVYYPKR